jgi:hypothetical protein
LFGRGGREHELKMSAIVGHRRETIVRRDHQSMANGLVRNAVQHRSAENIRRLGLLRTAAVALREDGRNLGVENKSDAERKR